MIRRVGKWVQTAHIVSLVLLILKLFDVVVFSWWLVFLPSVLSAYFVLTLICAILILPELIKRLQQ